MSADQAAEATEAVEAATEAATEAAVEARCPLCLERLGGRGGVGAGRCGHLYCWSCAQAALARQQECPLCRAPATSILPCRNFPG